jgi:ATP-binding cassette subfamily C protein
MQMNTIVSEGSTNISGGQRQRILIARALALKPSIIVCDEATSALDNRTQAIVTKSLDKLHATRIIVAHRLSTIRNADVICVLHNGQIVEQGKHDELLALNGYYAKLSAMQQ